MRNSHVSPLNEPGGWEKCIGLIDGKDLWKAEGFAACRTEYLERYIPSAARLTLPYVTCRPIPQLCTTCAHYDELLYLKLGLRSSGLVFLIFFCVYFEFGSVYQRNRLSGNTRLGNNLLCIGSSGRSYSTQGRSYPRQTGRETQVDLSSHSGHDTRPPASHIATSSADATSRFRHPQPQTRSAPCAQTHRDRETENKTDKKRVQGPHARDFGVRWGLLPMSDVRRPGDEVCHGRGSAVWCGSTLDRSGIGDHVLPRYHPVVPVSTRSVGGVPNCSPQCDLFPSSHSGHRAPGTWQSAAERSIESVADAVFY